jgi:diguanylate cyclase (GGDEF)-like protein
VRGAPSSEVTWQAPMRVVLAAALVLCIAVLFMRWHDARSRAQSDGLAALALIEQQPASVNVQAPAYLAEAMKPHASILSLSHCIGAQCSTVYAQPQAAPCEYPAGLKPHCVSVPSKANIGYALLVRYDLLAVLVAASLDLAVSGLLFGVVLLLWYAHVQKAQANGKAAVAQQVKLGAERDPLTGVLNRVAFESALKRHNESTKQVSKGTDGCLMYFDLDRFKLINDTHGHIAGDVVLKTVAQRLKYTLGDVMIGRLGGDEFAVLLVDVGAQDKIEQMGKVLIEQVSKPIQIDKVSDYVGLSIGAYMLKRGELSVGDMLHRADLAMYEAKRSGRGRLVFYEESMEQASRGHAEIQSDLKKALDERQLFMVYQPELDANECVRGMEALVRWRHPTRGLVSPDDFIPVAEKNGLIVPLGKMILDLVCADIVTVRNEHINLPYVSVNVSLRELSSPTFVEDVMATLRRRGLEPADIEFEITESTAMVGQAGKESIILKRLSDLGFRLAVDDFGSGYSSIARLLDLKVQKLKIDRVFVGAIGKPGFDPALLELMIALSGRLALKSVAEGVETPAQAAWLREAGCMMMQGYLYARPMTQQQLINWMREQSAGCDVDGGVWASTQPAEASIC